MTLFVALACISMWNVGGALVYFRLLSNTRSDLKRFGLFLGCIIFLFCLPICGLEKLMSIFLLTQGERAGTFAVFIPPLIVGWKLRKLAELSSLRDAQDKKAEK